MMMRGLGCVLAIAVGGRAPGAVLIVDQNAAQADGCFRTIQAAVDAAQPGDTVSIRAGVYHESVKLRRSGTSFGALVRMEPDKAKWITLEADGDEHVVLDGTVEVPAADWRLAEGKSNTYVAAFVCKGWNKALQMVFAGDELILPSLAPNPNRNQPDRPLLPAMPGDRAEDQGFFYDKEADLLYVNAGGRAPGRDVAVRASELDGCIDGANQAYFRVRKLEIRGYNQQGVIVYNAHEFVVEDNYIHHVGTGMWGYPSSGGVIRRNTFADIMHMGMGMGATLGGVIESNLFRRFNINPYKTLDYAASIMCNGANGLVIRNNVITEDMSDCVGGPWPDCSAMGLGLYGNTCYGLTGHGFYIEAGAYAAALRWNCCFDNASGITFRQNCMNSAVENYVFRNRLAGLAISSTDAIQPRPVGNTMMYNWVIDNQQGVSTGPDRDGEMAQAFDHNSYRVPQGGVLFSFGSKQYLSLETLRAEVGEEMHGKVAEDFDPAQLGLVTFRVAGTKREWEPVPMFGNPDCTRGDVLSNYPETYFWRRGTFEEEKPDGWRGVPVTHVAGGAFTWGQTQGIVRLMDTSGIEYVRNYPGGLVEASIDDPNAAHSDSMCLQAAAIPDETVSPEGVGYWGVSLPTVDGAKIDVGLWLKASGVEAENGGGVYVFAEFCDATGQHRQREYVVGASDGGEIARPECASGSYEMRRLEASVTAPEGARWFRLAMGLRHCRGVASFDDIEIHTEPGQQPG